MARKVLFMVAEENDGVVGIATRDFKPDRALDVLSQAVEFAMEVGKEMVGLTSEEAELNIYKAVDITLQRLEEK